MSLDIKNLTMKFGDFIAVDDINIHISKGEMFGFLGGNGAGKTTTFRMILKLLKPTSGTITYDNQKIGYHMTDSIGYLPEDRGLHPKLTVEEQVTYLAQLKGMNKKTAKETLIYWLERFEVPENLNKKIGSLSKGNQQKIQLIASIIHSPELIILDEPFSGLDPINVELLKKAVKDLNKEGATIIFSSHRMEHVEEMCESICILNKGKQVVSGTIKDIKNDFKQKTIIIKGNHDISFLKEEPGVISMTETNEQTKLIIEDESYAETIYNKVTPLGYFKEFSVNEPSLNDIFIEKVGHRL